MYTESHYLGDPGGGVPGSTPGVVEPRALSLIGTYQPLEYKGLERSAKKKHYIGRVASAGSSGRYWLAMMSEENFNTVLARQVFGFPSRIGKNLSQKVKPGDKIIVYVTKRDCKDYCRSFAAVLEVAGPWRESPGPTWPDEVREHEVKYNPIVDVRVLVEGKLSLDEAAGELGKLGLKIESVRDLRRLYLMQGLAGPLPEAAGRLIEKILARSAKATTQAPPAQASPPPQAPAAVAAAAPPAAPQAPAAATTVQAPAAPAPAACSPERLEKLKEKFKAKLGRDLRDELELAAAGALEGLGFKVEVEKQVETKRGKTIEIDVWGEKDVGGLKLYAYVSCKNQSLKRPVDKNFVEDEVKRVARLLRGREIHSMPHMRILVVSSIRGTAKQEALDKGFIVVEVGKKVDESNVEEACRLIYDRLSAAFVEMASASLPELANLTAELRDSLQEFASVDNRLRSVADKLVGLLQRSAR